MRGRAARVLVSGLVLEEEHAGTTRHAAQILPRVAAGLAAEGGELVVLAGESGLAQSLPDSLRRVHCDVPAHPAWKRARAESAALQHALTQARISGRPFDLVHTGHLPTPRGLDVPFTWLVHDLRRADMGSAPSRWLSRLAIRRAARCSAATLTVSAASAARLRALTGVQAHVIPNGHEHFRPLPRSNPSQPFMLGVGHIEPRKNWGTLIDAMAHDPALPDLKIVGASKAEHRSHLEASIQRLNLGKRVRFVGTLSEEELRANYATCSAVVLPSLYEGCLLYTSPSPRDRTRSRMPSSA